MSDAILLDTNVVSYIMKGGELADLYERHTRSKLAAISFVTLGELYFGAEKAGWGEDRRRTLEQTLRDFVVIPYDHEVAYTYGRLCAECSRMGKALSANDAWIAACAVRHGIPLLTHNIRHFTHIPSLTVISEGKNA